jgi:ribonuclease D
MLEKTESKKLMTSSILALLKSLSRWREVTAQNQNRPRAWVLKDDAIQEIAAIKPKKPDDLQGLRFFRYDSRLAADILGVVDYALNEEKPPKLEKENPFPENAMPVLILLRVLLKTQSVKHDIAPSVIADLQDLEDIAVGAYKHSKAMKGWRYDVFGKYAQKLKEGKLALTADGSNIVLIEPAYD